MDIDIDFRNRDEILPHIRHVPAIVLTGGKVVKHVCGVYVQNIPVDERGWSAIPYGLAEEQGWFKIDFLNNSTYGRVRDEAHLDELLSREVDWDLFLDESITSTLPQVGGHPALLVEMKPRSVMELAMTLALIRPGKRHLIGRSWEEIEAVIWDQETEGGFTYKKSHAVAFALSVIVALHVSVTPSSPE